MRLHNLRPRPGAKHRVKRLGIGESSGHGKTSGKGHKGQKARSGGSIRLGFEGGQMPLIRRLPKRGFNNAAFKKHYAVINLDDLSQFEAGSVINEQMLRESKHVRGKVVGLKILGRGELTHGLTIEADKVSESAREKIEKAGGTVTLKEPRGPNGPRHAQPEAKPVSAAPPAKAKKPVAKKKKTAK
ncbi:MAG: 50S ribosomal protein L15 [Chthoniobacterales bacterium]|nr:50S ribosomal protein L15 [Chthoniobacterales bacterium]